MSKAKRLSEEIFDARYKPKGRVGDACTYCGVVSDTMDHIPPLSLVSGMGACDLDGGNFVKVPACAECNGILTNHVILSIPDRREHVREKLRKRYARFLRIPKWDQDELDEMDPEFAKQIVASAKHGEWVRQRLMWGRQRRKADNVEASNG